LCHNSEKGYTFPTRNTPAAPGLAVAQSWIICENLEVGEEIKVGLRIE